MGIAAARPVTTKPKGAAFAVRNANRADVVLADPSPTVPATNIPRSAVRSKPPTAERPGRRGKALQLWMREEQWARLEAEREATGASVTELIRRAIDRTYT